MNWMNRKEQIWLQGHVYCFVKASFYFWTLLQSYLKIGTNAKNGVICVATSDVKCF